MGWNENSARLAGVSPGAIKIAAYVGSALLASAAGLFIASRTGSGDPLVGNTYQLSSISAAVLGGIDLFGGRGTVWGAIAGAIALAMIGNVLNLLGVVAYWQWILQGAVLLLAVALYAIDFGAIGSRMDGIGRGFPNQHKSDPPLKPGWRPAGMAKPYSDDLRERVVRAVEKGGSPPRSGWPIRRQREFCGQADATRSSDGKFQAG